MAWDIEYSGKALKALKRIDHTNAKRILDYMDNKVALLDNPRSLGKPLKGELGEFWRYRIGDYRVICEIQDNRLIILAALIGHRKEIYY